MKKYIPSEIEAKWQKKWAEDQLYKVDLDTKKEKQYVLVEFTYPSGDLHIGHWFTFLAPDIYARFKRMKGFEVFLPNGFDAFGLPAENAAIKRKIHPKDWTLTNIENMKKQFGTMGGSYDFDHEVVTCLPEYYKWNQWIFLKMLEKGIAYKGKALANWCPNCQTVLANENVEAGNCWRCGTQVVQKQVEQWFLKITEYVERLLWKEKSEDPDAGGTSVDWPKSVREGQNNWIGRSKGVVVNFDDIEIFGTRQDTIFGVTFIVISPEYHLIKDFITSENAKKVEDYLKLAKKKNEQERKENKEKTGVFTGSYVKNPMTGEKVPVWVADYVLAGYGTGAVMGVPAHDQRDFEFAKKFNLPIKTVITPVIPSKEGIDPHFREDDKVDSAYENEGVLINSGQYDGLSSSEARERIADYIEKNQLGQRRVNYHLHDWSISRQRYWGTPIPIIYCDDCGTVPVPEKDLPVELPYEVDYTPKGEPPLATNKEWLNVACPKCGKDARRDADTMDTFFDSSWYFFRYLDPKNNQQIFDAEIAKKWLPVDIYYGGAEHTLGHTLYSRFFTKFFKDIGLTDLEEYAKKRVQHGIVLGPDGEKMSKSRGNVINPDEEVKKYGADTVRLYLSFMMPYEATGPWQTDGVWGPFRFLQRVWALQNKVLARGEQSVIPAKAGIQENNRSPVNSLESPQDSLQPGMTKVGGMTNQDLQMMHATIKRVTEDIENIKSNTAIAALMEWINYLSRKPQISREEYENYILLLAPFAPHITEELWSVLEGEYSIHQQNWPESDSRYLVKEQISLAVQVNGKLRDLLVISKDILNDRKDIEDRALKSEKIQKLIGGKDVVKIIHVPGKILNFVVSQDKQNS